MSDARVKDPFAERLPRMLHEIVEAPDGHPDRPPPGGPDSGKVPGQRLPPQIPEATRLFESGSEDEGWRFDAQWGLQQHSE